MNSSASNSCIPLRIAKQQLQDTYVSSLGKESLLSYLEKAIADVKSTHVDIEHGKKRGGGREGTKKQIRNVAKLIAGIIIAIGGGAGVGAVSYCLHNIPYVAGMISAVTTAVPLCRSPDTIVGSIEVAMRLSLSKVTGISSCSQALASVENFMTILSLAGGGTIAGIFGLTATQLTNKIEQILTCGKVIPSTDEDHTDTHYRHKDDHEDDPGTRGSGHSTPSLGVDEIRIRGGFRQSNSYRRRRRQTKRRTRR